MNSGLNSTFGATLIGCFISAILYGITVTQTYLYYERFPGDHYSLKTTVAVLWLLDTVHLVLIFHSMYYYVITNFSNPDALASTIWSFNLEFTFNTLIGALAQFFFMRRMLVMSGGSTVGWCLTVVVCLLSLIHLALGIFFTDRIFVIPEISKLPQLTWVSKVGMGAATAADGIIAISLCYYLYNSRTGYKKTDTIIARLMLYTINCGLLTGVCASITALTFSILKDTLVFLGIYFVLGKLYCNSCLAMLNSREALRRRDAYETSSSSRIVEQRFPRRFVPSQYSTIDIEFAHSEPTSPPPVITVGMDTTVETAR